MKKSQLLAPVALAIAVSPLLAACTGVGAQQLTAAEIVQKMRDNMKTVTSVESTVNLSVIINKDGIKTLVAGLMPGGVSAPNKPAKDWTSQLPDSVNVTLNTWQQSPDKVRVDVESASFPNAKGATLVYDGQKAYALDPSRNTVYTLTPGQHIDQVPDEIKAVVAGLDFEKELDKAISATDITLAGNEKVAGLDAYKLNVVPKPDAADLLGIPAQFKMQAGVLIKDAKMTLWVDQAQMMPLKVLLEHPNLGSFTYEATKLEVNKTIDASRFVLQVPADATVVDLDQMSQQAQPQQVTLPEARDQATTQGWALLEPSYVPSGATLVGVTQMQKALGGGITLSYSSSSLDFTIAQANLKAAGIQLEDFMGLGDGFSGVNNPAAIQDVTVRGVTAKAFSPQGAGWTSLIWQEKGSDVVVAIRGKLTLAEATKIAEGLK